MTLPPRLHTFDLALIVAYLIGITLFGLRFRKSGNKDKSLRNYFLAGNTVPWWAIALSIVSAETSTLTIISVPGVAFAGDFGFLQIVLGYMIGRIVVAMLFLPRYFDGKMLTAYQLIDQRFGATLHKVTAGLFLLTRAAAEGVRVFAVSIVVGIAIGTRDVLSIGIISALTLLYTFEGGMAAVIWTDVVQMAIYVAGTLVAIGTLGGHVPGGWTHIHAVAGAAGKFHLFNFALNLTQSYNFWAGALGGTFLTMASHGTDQLMVQRMLAARSLRESRLALLSSGVVIFFQFTLFLLIGAGLYVFYGLHPQAFASTDRIFPTFIVAEMPIGVAGLLVAAILAAAMSNLSAALNSLSSTTVVDFYMHLRPKADDRERMMISRSSTVVWALVLFAMAIYTARVGGKGHVVEIGLSIASVAYGALLGVFLLGTLTKYATQTGAIIGMIVGFAFNVVLWQLPNAKYDLTTDLIDGKMHSIGFTIPQVAFTWFVFLGAVMTFVVGSLASLVFRKPRKAVAVAVMVLMVCAGARAGAQESHVIVGPPVQMPPQGPEFAPVSALIETAIAQKKLPGAVLVVGHGGKVVFESAYGVRKYAGEPGLDGQPSPAEPMTIDTIFDMASLTKCLATATAIMQLYEAHKIAFDDPVAKYIPEFAANGKQSVTIRELLTHYSGLPPDVDLKDAWGLAAPDKAEGLRRAFDSPLKTVPGTHFEYSDINFIVLGAIVERLSGQALDKFVAENVFEPLHMARTRYLRMDMACGVNGFIPLSNRPDRKGKIPVEAIVDPCIPDMWERQKWLPNTAPTAHDDESKDNSAANPDFDHLLRGTVHDPTTRRMGGVAGQAGVFSTAEDVSLYARALLQKLKYNTGPFPLTQATLKLMTTPEQPATAESTATTFTPDGQPTKGVATRGFGWDINTAFSRPRGGVFPIGSFGHTGFTGTSLWMDPASDSYVVLLANAVHPRGNTPISALRGQVATAVAKVLGVAVPPSSASSAVPKAADADRTLTGIDSLEMTHFAVLAKAAERHGGHLRLGLLTNQSGLDAQGRRTVDILATDAAKAVPGLALTALFSPEHGISGTHDDTHIGSETDAATHIPVRSLYGPKESDKRPKPADLAELDAVVIDLQDAGVRFYTYETVMSYFLEAAACRKVEGQSIEVIVLDRPNLIGGSRLQGPISDADKSAYINYIPLPAWHDMTLAELARYYRRNKVADCSGLAGGHAAPAVPATAASGEHVAADLTIVPMHNWTRAKYFDETGLPWTNPSPNLRSMRAAVLYPGVAFLETTNVSIGRGMETPFEQIGAPYIKPEELVAYLAARHIAGVTATVTHFSIAEDSNHYPYHGQTIPGVHFTVTDRTAFESSEFGLELLAAMHHLYPTQFNLAKAVTIVANAATIQALTAGEDPRSIVAGWTASMTQFRDRRAGDLLYP